ncbi:hypothetical protein BH11GEM1_BH11GEM1_05140 [soil metagenome]
MREGQPPRTSVTGERAAIPELRRTLSAPAGYARSIFILFWPAALGVAAFAGLGPALLSSALSVMAVEFILTEPRFTFLVRDTKDFAPFGIFLLASSRGS